MAKIYITNQDDELDKICFDYYGYTSGSIELVLEANRDLAKELPYIPEGTQIVLPELPKPTQTTTTRLWE